MRPIAVFVALLPWAANHDPTDVPKRHVQEIAAGDAEYTIVQGGTIDGRNCRSPQGVWTPFEQTWESNRSVRLENVGQTDIVNPWLSNGRNNFRNIKEIVAQAIEPGMTDKEKALALYWQEVHYRFHYEGFNNDVSNPVKVFNVYGHNTCGNDSVCMAGLWKTAGLKVAPARLTGHCISQVYYDGGWHLFDGDMHSMYLSRDNETIASEQHLVRDHDLIRRTHTQGILRPDGEDGDQWESSIYVFEGDIYGDRDSREHDTSMNMTLRPGEALVWRWGRLDPVKHHGADEVCKFPDRICNGLWEYWPDFTKDLWRKGADSVEGIQSDDHGLTAADGKMGVIVWTIHSPYVLVGGHLDVDGTGAKFEISLDGKKWKPVETDLDKSFPPTGEPFYSYQLKCQLAGDARLNSLGIVNDVQMAPLTLPEMGIGNNKFTYTDQTKGERHVRITHEWVERSASRPPAAPSAPISPANGGDDEGTAVVFEWQPAVDPDGDAIDDYHFELSSRPDMKWPLSMSFAKLVSRTSDAGSARYTLAAPGELTPDQKYYWHVRAKDAHGVWGPWSQTWSFTPRGPSYPLSVTLNYDAQSNVGTLHWTPNPMGRQPISYRVYASDEKGFTINDDSYGVVAGIYDVHQRNSNEPSVEFSANFVTETQANELTVIGSQSHPAAANKAFYRVVAVDQQGNRSGPSDYAESPRPVICSQPITIARIGSEYRYDAGVIRSQGDLRTRLVNGKEVMKYWDVEQPRFRIEQGPDWLKVDEATGRLSGIPDRSGKSDVVIAVTLEKDERNLNPELLQWGIERITGTGTKTIGTATQSFVIDTRP